MNSSRFAVLFGALTCAAIAATAPTAACNGTGVTPTCDFPDGANNPESGCGELVEAAIEDASADAEDASPVEDSSLGRADALDATAPPPSDSGEDSGGDGAHDASDTNIADAHHDAKG